jgi:anaerobic carbon-monoxide dehydrogenase iron sulfur subunit
MNAITFLPDLCTGCQSCEMVCSLSHEGISSPSLSRIQIKKWPEIAVFLPVVCQQCEKAPCITICPTKARKRVPETGAIVTDEKWCVGCKSCIYACPYSAPVIHPSEGKTMTCDLCKGKPLCVKVCTVGALSDTAEGKLSPGRKETLGQRFIRSFGTGR